MNPFQSTEQLYQIAHSLFDSLEPAAIEPFTSSNLVIRLVIEQPDGEILLDGRQPPLEVFYGPRPGQANLEMRFSGDLLHQIWSGQEEMHQALFSGRIEITGNLMKAQPIMDLFRECQRHYPALIQTD